MATQSPQDIDHFKTLAYLRAKAILRFKLVVRWDARGPRVRKEEILRSRTRNSPFGRSEKKVVAIVVAKEYRKASLRYTYIDIVALLLNLESFQMI